MVGPIRICRGAFADNMPRRDLLVSPDHAILVDGKLIAARKLVNTTTIRHEKGWNTVDYFHVQLERHAIMLAEDLPVESYLDTGNRGFFTNASEPLVLHPDLTEEADNPTREAGSCAPFVSDAGSVRPIWQKLADRAAALGHPAPFVEMTSDSGLRLFAGGRLVKPFHSENGLYVFALAGGACEVRLVSRANAPTDSQLWLEDRRRLGICVESIVFRSTNGPQAIPLDHPSLLHGWWQVEVNGTALHRWTGGNAVLPLPACEAPIMLEIRASTCAMRYSVEEDVQVSTSVAA